MTNRDPDDETLRQAGSTPEDGTQSTHPKGWPGIPDRDEAMRRSAEGGEGEVADVTREQEELEGGLPSNRAQERGGP